MKIQKIATIALLALSAVSTVAVTNADARGRKGSHRAYHGHGKGSFYKGGHSWNLPAGGRFMIAQTQCNDGSSSNSSGRGTCSYHGGEAH